MEKMFCAGLIVGGIIGALIVANSAKARSMVDKGQSEIKKQIKNMGKSKKTTAQVVKK